MPAVTVTAAVGAKRRGSAGSGLGTGSRLAGAGKAGAVKLRAAEAGTAKAQGSGVAEKQEAGRENMK